MSNQKVSLPVIRRLPRYFRYITELKASGKTRVSSGQLADLMGSTPRTLTVLAVLASRVSVTA